MKSQSNKNILSDIAKIKCCIGKNAESIGLFGSSTIDFDAANDIDIVIFTNNLTVEFAKEILTKINLNYPVKAKYINGSYSSIIKSVAKTKHYHIIILSDQEAKDRFVKKNMNNIIYQNV